MKNLIILFFAVIAMNTIKEDENAAAKIESMLLDDYDSSEIKEVMIQNDIDSLSEIELDDYPEPIDD